MNTPRVTFTPAIILGLTYALSVMDRQIIAILIEPIKADMQLSDTQLAMMSGLVFALFYGLMGLPIARLADKNNRVNLLSVCIGLWSVMTALSGMALNFVQLLLARIGVGIGEAGCQPAGQSIIADLYEEERRSRALSFFSAGAPIGALIAYLIGGTLADTYGWRTTLLIAGIPGIVFAIAIRFMLREPERHRVASDTELSGVKQSDVKQSDIKQDILTLLSIPIYRLALIGHIFVICLMYVLMMWVPSIMVRSFGLSLSEVGLLMGSTALVGGFFGSILSGVVTDKMAAKSPVWFGYLPMLHCLISIPLFLLCLITESLVIFVACISLVLLFTNAHTPPTYATYHKSVPSHLRALAVAISTLGVNIIGLGLAPLIIGGVSDYLEPQYGNDSLKMAMLSAVVYLPLGAWCYWRIGQRFRNHGQEVTDKTVGAAAN